jgi:hypothetical protein
MFKKAERRRVYHQNTKRGIVRARTAELNTKGTKDTKGSGGGRRRFTTKAPRLQGVEPEKEKHKEHEGHKGSGPGPRDPDPDP